MGEDNGKLVYSNMRDTSDIYKLIRGGDYGPVQEVAAGWGAALPQNRGEEGQEKLEKFADKYPDRATRAYLDTLKMCPQYANAAELAKRTGGTTNIVAILDGLSHSQKEKLLEEKLAELGITKEKLQDIGKDRQVDSSGGCVGGGEEV